MVPNPFLLSVAYFPGCNPFCPDFCPIISLLFPDLSFHVVMICPLEGIVPSPLGLEPSYQLVKPGILFKSLKEEESLADAALISAI